MRVRKKPVEVDAIHWTGLNADQIFKFVGEEHVNNGTVRIFNHDQTVTIQTKEGLMTASKDDYIIRGIQGELYPCKPDIFEKTYDIL